MADQLKLAYPPATKRIVGSRHSGAHFSGCGRYRYVLWRFWDREKPRAMCIGLNPSDANIKKVNDNTIITLIRVLKQLGYGGFYMTNLFAWISSNPKDLLNCVDPVGPNDLILEIVRNKANDVIVCWGNFKQAKDRIKEVLPMFPNALCFGVNKNGTPFHPRAMIYKKGMLENPQLLPYSHREGANQPLNQSTNV